MPEGAPVEVVAASLHVDVHAGQLEVRLGQHARGLGRDVGGDTHQVEARAGVLVERLVDVRGRHVDQLRQARHDGVALGEWQVRGPDLDRERRDVVDQLAALAVVDEAARRANRLERGSLRLRQVGEVAAAGHLEVEEAHAERNDHEDDGDAEDDETRQ